MGTQRRAYSALLSAILAGMEDALWAPIQRVIAGYIDRDGGRAKGTAFSLDLLEWNAMGRSTGAGPGLPDGRALIRDTKGFSTP